MVEDGALSHKIDYITSYKEILNPEVHQKSHNLFKSYGDFAEWVDMPFGGASVVKGLRLQPAQQVCSL